MPKKQKTFSFIRKIDKLGRIVIPKDLRKLMDLREGTELDIVCTEQGILIKNR